MKDYTLFLQKSLYNIVKDILTDVAQNGLTDDSYYVLSFKTPSATLPDFIRAQYPEEITIILQHRFENLSVDDKGISVTLGFGGIPCSVYIPCSSLISFVDPSKKCVLTFPSDTKKNDEQNSTTSAEVIDLASRRKKK